MKRLGWVLLLVACGGPADPDDPASVDLAEHREGFDALCHAEARSGAIEQFPFAAKTAAINGWLTNHLDDAYVRKMYTEKLPQEPLAQQGQILRDQAARAGVTPCPLGGLIDFLGQLSTVANAVDDCRSACVERHEGLGVHDLEGACTRGCGG